MPVGHMMNSFIYTCIYSIQYTRCCTQYDEYVKVTKNDHLSSSVSVYIYIHIYVCVYIYIHTNTCTISRLSTGGWYGGWEVDTSTTGAALRC